LCVRNLKQISAFRIPGIVDDSIESAEFFDRKIYSISLICFFGYRS